MRKFFLFTLLLVCFLFAGVIKNDLMLCVFTKQNYSLVNYTLNSSLHALSYGETICAEREAFNLNAFLTEFNAQDVLEEDVCDRTIIYAYSNKLSNYVYVQGKKVNLQIAICDDDVRIGYPLIMGAF